MGADWFPLGPGTTTFSRITLDFRLRSANQHFLELVVPGIGGARFVRQITWALAGIALKEDFATRGRRLRATPIANAIEAIGCKSEYLYSPTDISERVLGRRAFGRDGADISSFSELSDRRHYVQNTFRGTIVRTIRDKFGLGFAEGPRFEALKLTTAGRTAAAALLDGPRVGRGKGTPLRKWLSGWILGDNTPPWRSMRDALSPETPTKAERELIRARLFDVEGKAAKKRRDLADVLETERAFPGIDQILRELRKRRQETQAREIELACAFGAMLDACIAVVTELSDLVEKNGSLKVSAAARAVSSRLGALSELGATYLKREKRVPSATSLTANRFARSVSTASETTILNDLLRREGKVVQGIDGHVHKGPLFRNLTTSTESDDDGASSEEETEVVRTFRLARYHELLRDTRRST